MDNILPRKDDFMTNSLTAVPTTAKDGDCPMCWQEFTDPVQTPCKHTVCSECAKAWFNTSNRCPGCNVALFMIPPQLPQWLEEVRFDVDVDQDAVITECNRYIERWEDSTDFTVPRRSIVRIDKTKLCPSALGVILYLKPDSRCTACEEDHTHKLTCGGEKTLEELCRPEWLQVASAVSKVLEREDGNVIFCEGLKVSLEWTIHLALSLDEGMPEYNFIFLNGRTFETDLKDVVDYVVWCAARYFDEEGG